MIINNPELPPSYENLAGSLLTSAMILQNLVAEHALSPELTDTEVAFIDTSVRAAESCRECARLYMRIAALSASMIDEGTASGDDIDAYR